MSSSAGSVAAIIVIKVDRCSTVKDVIQTTEFGIINRVTDNEVINTYNPFLVEWIAYHHSSLSRMITRSGLNLLHWLAPAKEKFSSAQLQVLRMSNPCKIMNFISRKFHWNVGCILVHLASSLNIVSSWWSGQNSIPQASLLMTRVDRHLSKPQF